MQAGAVPLYCSDRCRSVPERSFVKRMYDASETAAEEAGFADFAEFDAAVRANFSARRRAVTSRTGTVAGIKRRTAVSGELEEPAVPLLK